VRLFSLLRVGASTFAPSGPRSLSPLDVHIFDTEAEDLKVLQCCQRPRQRSGSSHPNAITVYDDTLCKAIHKSSVVSPVSSGSVVAISLQPSGFTSFSPTRSSRDIMPSQRSRSAFHSFKSGARTLAPSKPRWFPSTIIAALRTQIHFGQCFQFSQSRHKPFEIHRGHAHKA
jgi:hypothetical protein